MQKQNIDNQLLAFKSHELKSKNDCSLIMTANKLTSMKLRYEFPDLLELNKGDNFIVGLLILYVLSGKHFAEKMFIEGFRTTDFNKLPNLASTVQRHVNFIKLLGEW